MVKSAARIYVLLARDAPKAVVFRRGPSNQVLLIKWDLAKNSFEVGQWLKGRIYERRCDLSPDGELLVYFAADFRRSIRSWSAVSRPPYFTALDIWTKGNCWGGGGLFFSNDRLMINDFPEDIKLAPEFSMPSWLAVGSCGEWSGRGEDDPIWSCRLARDGWKLTAYPEKTKNDHGAKVWIEYDPPITWEKLHPFWPKKYILRMSILGIKERDGPCVAHRAFHCTARTASAVTSVGVNGLTGRQPATCSLHNPAVSIGYDLRSESSVRLKKANRSPTSMISHSSVLRRLRVRFRGRREERSFERSKLGGNGEPKVSSFQTPNMPNLRRPGPAWKLGWCSSSITGFTSTISKLSIRP